MKINFLLHFYNIPNIHGSSLKIRTRMYRLYEMTETEILFLLHVIYSQNVLQAAQTLIVYFYCF